MHLKTGLGWLSSEENGLHQLVLCLGEDVAIYTYLNQFFRL